MSDKFSFYQTEGLWGIIENASDKKQTSIKSYFGSDLIVKLLNEQADQIDQLKQQLAEKDKEIERLKNLFELNNEVVINQGKEIFGLRVQVLQQKQNQTQLAIQELEKLKEEFNGFFSISIQQEMFDKYINKQIKELKGEK